MPADGNGILHRNRADPAEAVHGVDRVERAWVDRAPPGPAAARLRRRVDPAAEAMSRNPNLSPPIHFGSDR